MEKEDYVLALYDISNAIIWTFKSNFDEFKHPEQVISVSKIESIVIDKEICIYVQHFKVIWNIITDSLSRDHYIPDYQITCLLLSIPPN